MAYTGSKDTPLYSGPSRYWLYAICSFFWTRDERDLPAGFPTGSRTPSYSPSPERPLFRAGMNGEESPPNFSEGGLRRVPHPIKMPRAGARGASLEVAAGSHEQQHGNRQHKVDPGSEKRGPTPLGHFCRCRGPLGCCRHRRNNSLLVRPNNRVDIGHHDDPQ